MKMVGLHAIRKKKGYSQLKVAMDLSISREAISYYENGLRCPNLEMLVKLSDYFNVSIDYLITGKNFGEQTNRIFHKTNHRSAQNVKIHKNVLTNQLNGDIIYLALKFVSKFTKTALLVSDFVNLLCGFVKFVFSSAKPICTSFNSKFNIQGYSSVGRAAVSKTACRGFESFCPCQGMMSQKWLR